MASEQTGIFLTRGQEGNLQFYDARQYGMWPRRTYKWLSDGLYQCWDIAKSNNTAFYAKISPNYWTATGRYEVKVIANRTCDEEFPADSDWDGIIDRTDNCRYAWNPDQHDCDLDGFGDACDFCNRD